MNGKQSKRIRKEIKKYEKKISSNVVDDFLEYLLDLPLATRIGFAFRIIFRR